MKILVFSELFYPHGSGAELATWLYLKMLAKEDFDIVVVTTKISDEPSHEILYERIRVYRVPTGFMIGTRYHTLSNSGILMSEFINRMIKWSDLVYIPGGWYSVIPLAKFHKRPVVVHLHNYSIVCPTSLFYDFVDQRVGKSSLRSFMLHEYIEKKRSLPYVIISCVMNEFIGKNYNKLAKLADALIFVSKTQLELITSECPDLRRKSHVVYNPIPDLPLVKSEQKGIGYFGGRSHVKGFHVLMSALRMVKENNVEVYLTKTSNKPKRLILNNGISINMLPKVDITVLQNMMKKISVTVIPSLYPEPLPYALIESMLYGKLIIASNLGGIPEIANSLRGVMLVQPGNSLAISDLLNRIISSLDMETINEMGMKNREYILRKIKNEDVLKSFIRILYKVIS